MCRDIFLNLGSRLSRDFYAVADETRTSLEPLIHKIFEKIESGALLAYGIHTQMEVFPCYNPALENSLHEFSTSVKRLEERHRKLLSSVACFPGTGDANWGSYGTEC